MINIKSNKGITLVSLVVTVILILILSAMTVENVRMSNGVEKRNNMVADIKLLNDKILVYYNKYQEIPKTDRKISIDGTYYYEIDLSKLDGVTLSYGSEYGENASLTNSSDLYVANENLNIYYLKGIEYEGNIYHTK